MIQRSAVVGTAIWVPPLIQSVRLPASAAVGSPQPCVVDGFMTGGGFVFLSGNSGSKAKYSLRKLDCPPLTSPPELKVDWKVGNVAYSFDLATFTSRLCTDTPIPNGPNANFDTAEGTGTGPLYVGTQPVQNGTVYFKFVDGGEPSATSPDIVTLIIKNAANVTVLNVVDQPVDGGNLQAHDGNYAFGNACSPPIPG